MTVIWTEHRIMQAIWDWHLATGRAPQQRDYRNDPYLPTAPTVRQRFGSLETAWRLTHRRFGPLGHGGPA